VVLLTVAAALAVPRRAEARSGAVALATAAALSLPAALGLPSTGTAVSHLVVTAALLSLMVRPAALTRGLPAPEAQAGPATGAVPAADREVLGYVALVCALVSAGVAALAVAGTGPAGVVVPGVVAALFAGAAPFARGAVRAVAACTGVLAAAGCVGAGSALASLPAHHAALALLAVPAATAVAGALLRRHPVALPVESAGAVVALVALALPVARPAYLALVLALCGIVASATALRPERRPAAGYAATALFVAAAWVRLALSEVSAPEAYALPVAVPALVVGVLRRRRDPEASSWTAYGPGLGTALVPSLVAAWGDPDWPRPLLLGAGALAVTLVGARWRLQAPLVLGGSVLGLVALHELAPYIVQVMGALPRWLPPALAGLLLLAAGATYEQRLRDARRLRETLGRMR
jgi:hypothetical protein